MKLTTKGTLASAVAAVAAASGVMTATPALAADNPAAPAPLAQSEGGLQAGTNGVVAKVPMRSHSAAGHVSSPLVPPAVENIAGGVQVPTLHPEEATVQAAPLAAEQTQATASVPGTALSGLAV